MKILELTGEPIYHGGQEKFIASLVENIDDENIQIDVCTPYDIDNVGFCDLIKERGGEVYSLGLDFNPGKSRRHILKELQSFFAVKKYDVVHIHSGSISVLAYAAKAAKDSCVKKIIAHSHCTGINSFKHTLVRAIFGRQVKNNATDYWACSVEAGKDKYPKSITESELVVIPNGINVEDFRRNDAKRAAIRSKLGIDSQCYAIGHVGRFSYQKNQEYLIDIFTDVHKKNNNSILILVGDGELFQEIRRKAENYNISDSVLFIGNVDNVSDYYQAMDCFVFPSRFEGFGYVVLEAQAAGIPCVVSTEVPKDAVVGKNISRLPLDNKEAWIKEITNYKTEPVVDNTEAILTSGYDIKNTANIVKNYYLNH